MIRYIELDNLPKNAMALSVHYKVIDVPLISLAPLLLRHADTKADHLNLKCLTKSCCKE